MTPLSIVCWRWRPASGYRSTFAPETVTVLRNMVARHYQRPHRFVCVTDAPSEIASDIATIQDWGDFTDLVSPSGDKNPSCYRRLRMFDPAISEVFGHRFVSLDLDTVIVGDMVPVWDRPEDFVIYGDTNPSTFYNGSMMLMTAGARPQVWRDFDPVRSPRLSHAAGHHGSDQGWISYCLGPLEAKWSKGDGVYSYRNDIRSTTGHRNPLPGDARIVLFHGNTDPWSEAGQNLPWVRRHWC